MNIPAKFNLPENRMLIFDGSGNVMVFKQSGVVHLHLAGMKRPRKIGLLKEDTLFVDRNSSKHVHYKTNSYGFNYLLLKKVPDLKYVVINEDNIRTYRVPVSVISDYGSVLNFKYAGNGESFEVQLFLRREYLKAYRQ